VGMKRLIDWYKKNVDWQHITLLLVFLVTTVLPQVVSIEQTVPALASWLEPTMKALSVLSGVLSLLKQSKAYISPVVAMVALCTCLSLFATACISDAPVVPVTAANQAQVSSCQSIASLHNGVVIGDFVVGGGTAVLTSASAALTADQQSTKTDLAVAGAITAGISVAASAIAGYTGAEFSNSQCSSVVGVLPASTDPVKP
jgi:hypothetical protein